MTPRSIRPFVGAKDYKVSRDFYCKLGFKETVLTPELSLFEFGTNAFYLQDAYVKEWVDNTMVFLEVDSLYDYWTELDRLQLSLNFENSRLLPIRIVDWGSVFYIYDPSGILWHVGKFKD